MSLLCCLSMGKTGCHHSGNFQIQKDCVDRGAARPGPAQGQRAFQGTLGQPHGLLAL